jgi:NADH:ubiquinone oxidoreductase subunit E
MKKKLILICTSERPKQSHELGCKALGSNKLIEAFQTKMEQKKDEIGEVEIRETICMNNCGNAICGRIFPGTGTYEKLSLDQVDEIWESHIKKSQEVKHLLTPKINRFLGL